MTRPPLTHAGDDAVDRQAGQAVVDGLVHSSAVPSGAAPGRLPLAADERRVLLLGDVDVEAGVGGAHDVARTRVQHDVGGVQPPHSDQTHAVPAQSRTDDRIRQEAVSSAGRIGPNIEGIHAKVSIGADTFENRNFCFVPFLLFCTSDFFSSTWFGSMDELLRLFLLQWKP